MNRTAITATLRTLDAADRRVDPTGPQARATLRRILAADPAPLPARPPVPPAAGRVAQPRPAARTTRRVALAAGAVAALAGVMVVLPALTAGDRAFATWTGVPQGMTVQQQSDAAASCRQQQRTGAGAPYAEALAGAEPVIAESRGTWTTVVLAGADGFSALCITDDSTHLFTKDWIGSVGTPTGYATPGPRDVVATDLGSGTIDAGDLSLAAGLAGPDVATVVYHSPTHGDVDATVSHGHFALWLPGDELRDAHHGVEVEVTYTDGTTGTSRLTL